MRDEARASALVTEIGLAVLDDPAYRSDWTGLAVSVIADGSGLEMTGYMFDADGRPTPAAPTDRDLARKFLELRAAAEVEDQGPWKAALLQIRRPSLEVAIDFEYADPARWKVTPANFRTKPAELRPREPA